VTQQIPAGEWALLAILVVMTSLVAVLALILQYQSHKLQLKADERKTAATITLNKRRSDGYLTLLEKAAGEPGSANAYVELIKADALHQAVENGTHPVDQTHRDLYGPQP
jgi:hypothetical protein